MTDNFLFISSNPYKVEEVEKLTSGYGITITHINYKINELQTDDILLLLRNKTLQAFEKYRLPVMVDHAGLYIDCLAGMPGALTQLFWDRLGSKICEIVNFYGNDSAQASTAIGLCDGKQIYLRESKKSGKITDHPRGSRSFQWDTIFIPEGETRTYAEMTVPEKNLISQRKIAIESLFNDLM